MASLRSLEKYLGKRTPPSPSLSLSMLLSMTTLIRRRGNLKMTKRLHPTRNVNKAIMKCLDQRTTSPSTLAPGSRFAIRARQARDTSLRVRKMDRFLLIEQLTGYL